MIVGMEARNKADNEAIKYARTVLKYTAQKKSFIKEVRQQIQGMENACRGGNKNIR